MQSKLGSLSEVRVQVTSNIKGSILHSPQLPVCQNLLDQLKQVRIKTTHCLRRRSAVIHILSLSLPLSLSLSLSLPPLSLPLHFLPFQGWWSMGEHFQRALRCPSARAYPHQEDVHQHLQWVLFDGEYAEGAGEAESTKASWCTGKLQSLSGTCTS